jgi:hypothetical protein
VRTSVRHEQRREGQATHRIVGRLAVNRRVQLDVGAGSELAGVAGDPLFDAPVGKGEGGGQVSHAVAADGGCMPGGLPSQRLLLPVMSA